MWPVPLYEYQCAKCGHEFEKIESFSASPTKKCPKCGGKAERQISQSAVQFKGSGWYVTDYAKSSAAGDGDKKEKPAAAEAKGEAKADSKGDAKAAKTGDSKASSGSAKKAKHTE
jgi:putative FmdB family regulatory protein